MTVTHPLRRTWLLALPIFLVISMACETTGNSAIEVTDVWLRPVIVDSATTASMTTPGMESGSTMDMTGGANGAIYMTIANNSESGDRLTAIEDLIFESGLEVARAVELHESKLNDGIMSMQKIEHGIPIPAKKSVFLEPGGAHVMLIGVTDDLKEGDRVSFSLEFEHGGSKTVRGVVEQR